MLRLWIDEPACVAPIGITVDEQTLVGVAADTLASQLGYTFPEGWRSGFCYTLHPASGEQPFPPEQRLAALHVRSESHFVIERLAFFDAQTRPLPAGNVANDAPRAWAHLNRRALLAGLVLTAGLGSGLLAAVVQHAIRSSRATSRTTAVLTPTTAPGASFLPIGTFVGGPGTVRALAWSPDGRFLASGGDDAALFIWTPDGAVQQRVEQQATVTALAWSPEGKRIMSAAANTVAFFDLTGAVQARFTHHHTGLVTSLAWSSRSEQLAVSAGVDRRAIIWNTSPYQARTVFTRHTAPILDVSWEVDGTAVASSSSGGVVRVWNALTGRETHPLFQDAPLPMRAAAFAPNSTALAVGGDDGLVRLWNGAVCMQAQHVRDAAVCQDSPQRLPAAQYGRIFALAWSPDGRHLACGCEDGSVQCWDVSMGNRGQLIATVVAQQRAPVLGLAWSPTGDRLAAASANSVFLWRVRL